MDQVESLREIRERIKAIEGTQKITKATNMVATTKLRRLQGRIVHIRHYAQKLYEVTIRTARAAPPRALAPGDVGGPSGLVVITSDKGLCGGYNVNVIRAALEHMGRRGEGAAGVVIIPWGRKGRDFFLKKGYEIIEERAGLPDQPEMDDIRGSSLRLLELYTEGRLSKIDMVYTRLISLAHLRPVVARLLPPPVETPESTTPEGPEGGVEIGVEVGIEAEAGVKYIYEPSWEKVMAGLLPYYVEVMAYQALVEAKASEFTARMQAMEEATDNADEMIEQLTLLYNRARQAEITQEVSEVIAGAQSLR